jgi:renalase
MATTPDVIVIGAGLCGLTAARLLQRHRHTVIVLEKSRGYGGRLARRPGGSGFAEHGLPYLISGLPQVDVLIHAAAAVGLLQPWQGSHWHLSEGQWQTAEQKRWIAPDGISSLGRWLAEGLTVHLQERASQLTRQNDCWQVSTEMGETWTAPNLVLALPAAQVQELLETADQSALAPWVATLNQVRMNRCLTLLARFIELPATVQLPALGWSVACPDSATLAWAGLDSSKRVSGAEPQVVLHSGVALARHCWEAPPEKIASLLLKAASRDLKLPLTEPESWQVHRWGYAVPSVGIDAACLSLPALGLTCGGDWAAAGLIEAQQAGIGMGSRYPARALASGEAMALALETAMGDRPR